MSKLFKEKQEHDIIQELYAAPVKDYFVFNDELSFGVFHVPCPKVAATIAQLFCNL